MTVLVDRVGAFTPFPFHRSRARLHLQNVHIAYALLRDSFRFPEHFEWNIYDTL